jgi:hypothetical protein
MEGRMGAQPELASTEAQDEPNRVVNRRLTQPGGVADVGSVDPDLARRPPGEGLDFGLGKQLGERHGDGRPTIDDGVLTEKNDFPRRAGASHVPR